MRIGLIARADSRGLGVQTKAFYDNMQPAKTLVVDCPSAKPLPLRFDWYPDATVVHGLPSNDDLERFVYELDVVFTCETAYNNDLYRIARKRGVRTVLQYNHEFFEHLHQPRLHKPDVFAAPSLWRMDEVHFENLVLLPVPVDTRKFTINESREARRFLHIVGRPAIYDRNGTLDVLKALPYIKTDIQVTLRCQEPGYVESMLHQVPNIPGNVQVTVEPGDVENYWDMYTGHDVLLMPRRFGGLCLPVNEALAAGMPVIMPNIAPNNQWLPADWLVGASKTATFHAHTHVDVHAVNPEAYAAKISEWADNSSIFQAQQQLAQEYARWLSWTALKPLYHKVLAGDDGSTPPAS